MSARPSSPAIWLAIIFLVAALLVAGERFLGPATFLLVGGTILVMALAAPLVGAWFIWSVVRGLNRRDDPRNARRPYDVP